MKKLTLLLALFLFSACSKQPPTTTPSTTLTESSTIPIATTTSETDLPITSSDTPILIDTRANLVGTWLQDGQSLTIDAAGNWHLSGTINNSGTLTIGADFNQTKMVKLYQFNQNIDGIGTYFIANFNQDSTKMNFGYLGKFTRSGTATETLDETLFQSNHQTVAIDFSYSLLGTWTITEGTEFQNTWNYNPDGTFETYSEGRGEAQTGTYTVKSLKNNWIDITYSFNNSADTYTTAYHLSDGVMWEKEFDYIKLVRNTNPAFP